MKRSNRILAMLLALVMCIGLLAGCGGNTPGSNANNNDNQTQQPDNNNDNQTDAPAAPANDTLVIAQDTFEGKFSPFFASCVPDQDVVDLVSGGTLVLDREAGIIYNGIEGETRTYNGTDYTYKGPANWTVTENADGTVTYTIELMKGLKFSDGEEVTADDLIFSIYAYSDPTYDGNVTLFATNIQGMKEYRANMTTLAAMLASLGEDNTDFTYVTEEQQTAFWAAVNDGGVKFAQEIVDYLIAAGANTAEDPIENVAPNWGFSLEAGATVKDFFMAIGENYDWNFSAMEAETGGSALSDLIPADVYAYSTMGISTGDSAPNISGVKKLDEYTVEITANGVDAALIYQLSISPTPLHYYGDESLYDYENNMFGFPKGDLSTIRAKSTVPLGFGPYVFSSYDSGTGVVALDANPHYYKGEPKIKHINFKFMSEADKINAIQSGAADIASPSFSNEAVAQMAEINGSESLDGDVITIKTTDYLGYGYIGINSKNVSVGGDGSSYESKCLRKAIATVLSVYRDVVIDSYYGEFAEVINYPISNTSWATPRVTDEGYKVAFSVDVNGNDIYTAGMSDEEKYAAALQAALGFFEAAGYTVTDGKLTAAPDGASLEYEIMIPAGGNGDHPNFMIMKMASDALSTIGFNLIVTDLSDGTATISSKLDAGTAEMWTMAWRATPDPDMYQIYYSDIANGAKAPGGSNNYYLIQDAELDTLIMDARASLDQSYRKIIYKEALDIVVDWACEIPIYQRTDCVIFSTERVNVDSIAKDMTPYWGYASEIETLELK